MAVHATIAKMPTICVSNEAPPNIPTAKTSQIPPSAEYMVPTKAATPPSVCMTPEPAKSTKPLYLSQPPSHTQWPTTG